MRAEALRLSLSLLGVLLFLLFSLLFIGVLSFLLYRIMWRRLQRIIDEAKEREGKSWESPRPDQAAGKCRDRSEL